MTAEGQNTDEHASRLSPATEEAMLAMIPRLRAFALSLCGNLDRADDLVQETLLRAIAHIDTFEPGTNFGAWLATILRNCFLSERRKRRNEVEDVEGQFMQTLRFAPEQESRLEFKEFRTALASLPYEQREALLLVGAAGLSYEDTATICQTTTGTIKSRINRARYRLATLLSITAISELGCDEATRAIMHVGCLAQRR